MITIEKVERRLYLAGDTFAVKERIKSLGGHWDADRKQWWLGIGKEVEVAELVESANKIASKPDMNHSTRKVDPSSTLVGKCKYKGRSYYILWKGQTKDGKEKARLTVLDGSIDFWVDASNIRVTTDWSGSMARGGYGSNRVRTLGDIQRFVEQQKSGINKRGRCTECDSWGPVGEPCQDCGGEGTHV